MRFGSKLSIRLVAKSGPYPMSKKVSDIDVNRIPLKWVMGRQKTDRLSDIWSGRYVGNLICQK